VWDEAFITQKLRVDDVTMEVTFVAELHSPLAALWWREKIDKTREKVVGMTKQLATTEGASRPYVRPP